MKGQKTMQYNLSFQTQNAKKNDENEAKQKHDFATSSANSYELWTIRRHETKQKQILAETLA